jgi:hypothetical protein
MIKRDAMQSALLDAHSHILDLRAQHTIMHLTVHKAKIDAKRAEEHAARHAGHAVEAMEEHQRATTMSRELDQLRSELSEQQRAHAIEIERLQQNSASCARDDYLAVLSSSRKRLRSMLECAANNAAENREDDLGGLHIPEKTSLETIAAMQAHHHEMRERIITARDAQRALALLDLSAEQYEDECALALHQLAEAHENHRRALAEQRDELCVRVEAELQSQVQSALLGELGSLRTAFREHKSELREQYDEALHALHENGGFVCIDDFPSTSPRLIEQSQDSEASYTLEQSHDSDLGYAYPDDTD